VSALPADAVAACRRAQVLGVLLVLSLLVYASVLRVIAARHAPFIGFAPSIDLWLLRVVFALLAVVDLGMLRFVTPHMLAAPRSAATLAPGPAVAPRLLSLSVVRLLICEAVAVLGVVLFLLGGRWADFCGFAVAALAAFAFNFPRRALWEDWMRQLPR
jgi:hypothetical protein